MLLTALLARNAGIKRAFLDLSRLFSLVFDSLVLLTPSGGPLVTLSDPEWHAVLAVYLYRPALRLPDLIDFHNDYNFPEW